MTHREQDNELLLRIVVESQPSLFESDSDTDLEDAVQ